MNITRKDIGKSQAELRIELSIEEVRSQLENATQKISEQTKIPGFRPGHVPYEVLVKHINEQAIYEEALQKIVEKSYPKALEQEKIEVVGMPKIEVEKLAPNNPIVYKAIVSLVPTITLGDYKKLNSKRKKTSVTDKEINDTLQGLQNMRAKETASTKPAQKGDRVIIDFTISRDNVVIDGGSAKKHPVIIGEGHYIPGLEDSLIGMKKDEEKTCPLTFPKDYHEKNLADQKVQFTTKVHDIFSRELPIMNDEFAQGFGKFKNLQELKDQITKNISQDLDQKEEHRFELALVDEVLGSSKISELPEILLEYEAKKMLHELEHDLKNQGGSMEGYLQSIKKTKEELEKDFRPKAEHRVKSALITREIALKESLNANTDEINAEIESSKRMYKDNADMLKQFSSEQYRSYVTHFLSNRKVFEFLKSCAEAKTTPQ